jgi:hypothetical protein
VVDVPDKDAQQRRIEEQLGHGEYGPGALDEVNVPPADDRAAAQRDDPAQVGVDMDELRDGGPTVTPGMVTTTGGKAGPASVHRLPGHPETKGKVAPTTTGDATTGGRRSPAGTSTSDASGGASQVGNFTDE